jgi:hypothetical protein
LITRESSVPAQRGQKRYSPAVGPSDMRFGL